MGSETGRHGHLHHDLAEGAGLSIGAQPGHMHVPGQIDGVGAGGQVDAVLRHGAVVLIEQYVPLGGQLIGMDEAAAGRRSA